MLTGALAGLEKWLLSSHSGGNWRTDLSPTREPSRFDSVHEQVVLRGGNPQFEILPIRWFLIRFLLIWWVSVDDIDLM